MFIINNNNKENMTNIKKIGLTALAASLVSTSAFAGAITVTGGASMDLTGMSGDGMNRPATYSMGDALTFSGSGTLENGLNVAMTFIADEDEEVGAVGPFYSRNLALSRDDLGKLVFAGQDGSSATQTVHKTVAGNIWDQFNSSVSGSGVTGVTRFSVTGSGANSFLYTTPNLVEGLNIFASLQPSTATAESYTGYGASYSGIAGLNASAARNTIAGGSAALDGDQTAMKATYAYGPITVGVSNTAYKVGTGAGAYSTSVKTDQSQDIRGYSVSYTVTDALSVSYGMETVDSGSTASGVVDAEFNKLSASYTMGGMSISTYMSNADNIAHGAASAQDQEKWGLGASFAF